MYKITMILLLLPSLVLADGTGNVYGGIRASQRHMGFKSGLGSHMFAKTMNQLSLVGGLNFNSWLGTELSIYSTDNTKRNATITFGKPELGVTNFSGAGDDSYTTFAKIFGSTVQITARYEFLDTLNAFIAAGVNLGQLKVRANMTQNDSLPATALEQTNNRIVQKRIRLFAMCTTGINYRISDSIGIRFDIGFERTRKLKMHFETLASAPNKYHLDPQNSVVYGLTIYFTA